MIMKCCGVVYGNVVDLVIHVRKNIPHYKDDKKELDKH